MPFMATDLGFTKAQLGILGSALYIAYGISKFVSGVMSDRSNPRYFMAIGLMLTGVMNILFGLSSPLWLLAILWGLNGWFQAWGWPAAIKLLTHWYAEKERGFWYSLCFTSHNLGGAVIPLLVVYCAAQYGWRWAMYVPGVISIVLGFYLINRLRDIPQTLGLPPIEEYQANPSYRTSMSADNMSQSLLSIREILFKQILNNKFVWILAISSFFAYVVRTAINDWSAFYLIEVKQYDPLLASAGVFWFEMGGLVGGLLIGWVSDYFFKGKRVPCIVICALGMLLSVYGLWATPAASVYIDFCYLTLLGAFIVGPHLLIGLAAAEWVDKRAAATSNGFIGTLGYFGAAVAGWPVGWAIDHWSWNGFFISQIFCSLIILVLLMPLWKMKRSYQAVEAPN